MNALELADENAFPHRVVSVAELRRLHEVERRFEELKRHGVPWQKYDELLGALKEIAEMFEAKTASEEYLMQTARAAILKATGESK